MTTEIQLLVIVLCLMGTGLFAGLETGVISIHRLRLRHMVRNHVPGARILEEFLEKPDHLLGTTLVGTNVCMVMASVVAASLAEHLFGSVGAWVSSVLMALVILVGCEYLPKSWFQGRPASRTRPFALFLKLAGYALYPASKAVMALSRILVPAPSPGQRNKEPFITKEEFSHLTHEGAASGELSDDELRMIHAVLDLWHLKTSDIMVPRDQVVQLADGTPTEVILETARAAGYKRFPVYSAAEGRVVGILHILDVLRDPVPEGKTARDYMRPPQFVGATVPADELLPRMRLSRQPMALVTNERSEVTGLVTSDRVLSRIIGTDTN